MKRTPINRKSNKQASLESQLKKVYEMIDNDREHICTGCGIGKNLSHSHIISRKRKEFMCDPDNITYHCLPIDGCNGCSSKWENVGERVNLNDYDKNMEYIKSVDYGLFKSMVLNDFEYWELHGAFLNRPQHLEYLTEEYLKIKI